MADRCSLDIEGCCTFRFDDGAMSPSEAVRVVGG
jgi:hypothetical protein